MKLDIRYRPELVASKDETRYQLADPYLDAEKKMLVATDGHRLLAVPVEVEEGEASRYVGRSLIRAARRWCRVEGPAEAEPHTVEIVGDGIPDGPSWPTHQERGKGFPDWAKVVPERKRGDPGTLTFALDPWYLKTLALALGGEDRAGGCTVIVTVDVTTNGRETALRVERHGKTALALLMPVAFAEADFAAVKFVPPAPAASEPVES